ncbi:hypothetical protein OC842_000728 [Tilletia horrida]|uniref:CAP-Gly domain-containing protein n=1 Tax=Tilletia horrida TaxID=155126 RepID=A0AAN6GGW3_9BASI|nr:hypothetical protein OC842_000728 [Tilletia horrida]
MSSGGGGGSAPSFTLHSRCSIARIGEGEILFFGQTSFAPGVWVGVALDEPNGKNNGTVQGRSYFDAPDGHGVFVRPSQVHSIEGAITPESSVVSSPPPRPSSSTPAVVTPALSRASSTRPSVPAAGISGAATPSSRVESPTKPSYSAARASLATSRVQSPTKPSLHAARPSLSSASSRVQSPTKPSLPASRPSLSSASSRVQSPTKPGLHASRASISSTPSAASRTAVPATPRARIAGSLGPGVGRVAGTPSAAPTTSTPSAGAARLQRPLGTPRAGVAPAARSTTDTPRGVAVTPRAGTTAGTPRIGVRPGGAAPSATVSAVRPGAALARQAAAAAAAAARTAPVAASSASTAEEDDPDTAPEERSATAAEQSTPTAPPQSGTSAAELTELMHELNEQRARVRILEKKRDEEREALRAAERKAEEAEGKEVVMEKLQERLKELQASVKDQHKLERELEQIRDNYEHQVLDLNEQLEMAMLDKEMAEEKYEVMAHDFETLKEEKEEVQLDLELAKEELALFEQGEVPEADRASAEFIKLQRQNQRLSDALIRVRDVSNEMEADLKHKITELDKELASLSDIQQQYDDAQARVQALEDANEDLRAQLDANLGAAEMVELLGERNLNLQEQVDMLKNEKEELEELQEISAGVEEELEAENRSLHEEIFTWESRFHQLQTRFDATQAELTTQEGWLEQYGDLVTTLNGEIATLRASRAIDDSGAGEDGFEPDSSRALAVAQRQAILEKEFQITRSASKKQAKTIEIELGKLKESQAMHQLDIIRSYLPPVYFNGDADAVAALLFFRRMSLKADIIKTVLESSHDIQDSLNNTVPEHLIDVCMLRHSLVHFGAISRQISSILNYATADDFLRAGQEFRTFAHIEKRIDAYIEALRNEELKEADCRKELTLYVDDFERFSQKFTSTHNAELPSMEVGVASLFEHDLDTLAAALGFAKQRVAALYEDEDIEWHLGSRSLEADIFEPLQQLISNVRMTKVPARKLTRRLQNLFISDEAIRVEATGAMPSLSANSTALVNFAKSLADNFAAYTTEVRTSKTPFVMSTVVQFIDEATNEAFKKSDQMMWTSALSMTTELQQTINQVLASATESENIIKVTGTKPWLTRVQQIQADMTHNADAERHISSQSEEIVHLRRTIKQREQYLQEHAVKIERLQIHLNRSKEQVDQMSDLRKQLDEARKQAKDYQEANDQLQSDLDRAEQEKTTLVQQQQQQQQAAAAQASAQKAAQQNGELGADGAGGVAGGVGGPGAAGFGGAGGLGLDYGAMGPGYAGASAAAGVLGYANMETSHLVDQLEALRGAVRYLRTENAYLRGADLMRGWKALPALAPLSGRLAQRTALSDKTNAQDATIGLDGDGLALDQSSPDAASSEPAKGDPVQQKRPGEELKSERLRAFAAETHRLHDQALKLVTSARIVDLSVLVSKSQASGAEAKGRAAAADPALSGTEAASAPSSAVDAPAVPTIRRPVWQPAARLPQNQYRAQKELAARIRARVEALSDKVRSSSGAIVGGGCQGTGGRWAMPHGPASVVAAS